MVVEVVDTEAELEPMYLKSEDVDGVFVCWYVSTNLVFPNNGPGDGNGAMTHSTGGGT